MKILATRQFAQEARAAATPLLTFLSKLFPRREPQEPWATRVGSDRIVGVSRDPRALNLHFCVEHPPSAPPAQDPPLGAVPRSQLRQWGIPDDLLEIVQNLREVSAVDGLPLTDHVKDVLRFRFIDSGQTEADREFIRCAPDANFMLDYLRGNLPDLLLHLDPTQERVVNLGGEGTIVLRGVAGSGKTSVILHRIRRLLMEAGPLRPPQILVLTYNRSLASASRELLTAMGGNLLKQVSIQTLHGWCRTYLNFSGVILLDKERTEVIERIVARVGSGCAQPDLKLWKFPTAFWAEEFARIKGRVTRGREEYLTMHRPGARLLREKNARELVYDAFEAYEVECQRMRRVDWSDVVRQAHERALSTGPSPTYDYVFVDEAQDFTVLALKLSAHLARELFVTFDAAQSIYERGFRWKDAGIVVHGARSIPLHNNFRNTRQILEMARGLLTEVHAEQDADDRLRPEARRDGSAPRHLHCSRGAEADAIATEIKARVPGVIPGNIAVLAYHNKLKHAIYCSLVEDHGLKCQEHDWDSEIRLSDSSIKVLPMKSAKGLEFPMVFLVASGRWFRPTSKMDQDEAAAFESELRRVFYVAMTRAMTELILVYPKDDPPWFLQQQKPSTGLTLGQLKSESGLGWSALLRKYGLPENARITNEMTLEQARRHVAGQPPETDLDRLLSDLWKESGLSWARFMEKMKLPAMLGIHKGMTLGEARRRAQGHQ